MATLFEKNSVVPDKKRIVFLGDSITDNGTFIANMDAYFYQHMPDKRITMINLGVSSETASGLSEPEHPFPRPCVHDRLERVLQESKPDWVVIGYGMNDGIYYPFSEERFQAYQEGIMEIIRRVKQGGGKAIVMTPPPFDPQSMGGDKLQPEGMEAYSWKAPYTNYNEVLERYTAWLLTLGEVADGTVNIYDPLLRSLEQERKLDPAYRSGDGIHPNRRGHWIIAKTILNRLFNISLERVPDYVEHPEQSEIYTLVLARRRLLSAAWKEHVGHTNPSKAEALPLAEALKRGELLGEQIHVLVSEMDDRHTTRISIWKGYERKDFYLEGREGILIQPKITAEGKPWVWRAEFFDAFSAADMALLEQGWHLAYYRLSNMYGCPYAINGMQRFQNYVTSTYGLDPKPVIFGFSRGGLYAFNYAAAYPQSVAALYLDAPVLDIQSWPGGKGRGSGAPREWEECQAIYGITDETYHAFKGSPIDHVSKVATAGIPILIVAGDDDRAVPLSENAAVLENQYRQMKGRIQMIAKPGIGHHPHSLEDPKPIVDFCKQVANTTTTTK